MKYKIQQLTELALSNEIMSEAILQKYNQLSKKEINDVIEQRKAFTKKDIAFFKNIKNIFDNPENDLEDNPESRELNKAKNKELAIVLLRIIAIILGAP